MVSIIICARTNDISEEMKENISSTIGVAYELVIIDNSQNQFSIFTAYNEGVSRAKGSILCFMHDDVVYRTEGWGMKLEEYFQDHPEAGMVGVIGSHFMPCTPSAWWDAELSSGRLVQGVTQDGKYSTEDVDRQKHREDPTRIAVIDGLWMCLPREMFDRVKWDSQTFSGFHGYDMDMSFQVWEKGREVHIFWDVLIEHKSLGVVQNQFYNAVDVVYKKWKQSFPFCKGVNMSEGEIEARTRLVEVKQELRERHVALKSVYDSTAYKIGRKLAPFVKWIH